jgi:hypothetical protein
MGNNAISSHWIPIYIGMVRGFKGEPEEDLIG